MGEDRLVLLGTKGGPSIRSHDRMPTSSLLEIGGRTYVVDCGLGVTRSLVRAAADLTGIDAVFITHLHSDHLLELGPLLHSAWTTGLVKEVDVYGPEGTSRHLECFFESMRYDIELRIEDEGRNDIRDLAKVHEFGEGEILAGDISVKALRVRHPPVEECYALRFSSDSWKVTFSSDTCYFPPLIEFAKGSDILVHEAMLPAGVDWVVGRARNATRLREHLAASHTLAGDVAKIAEAAVVGHLVLHHLIPTDNPRFGESDWLAETGAFTKRKVTVAEDGMEIKRTGQ